MMETKEEKRFFTPAEVAKILRCHVKTVREDIHSGDLIAARVGRAYIVEAPDLETFIQARKSKQRAAVSATA